MVGSGVLLNRSLWSVEMTPSPTLKPCPQQLALENIDALWDYLSERADIMGQNEEYHLRKKLFFVQQYVLQAHLPPEVK